MMKDHYHSNILIVFARVALLEISECQGNILKKCVIMEFYKEWKKQGVNIEINN